MPFIVLEGLDGAGKSTQIKRLQTLLADSGRDYEYLHFPRFDAPVYGDLVARFLRGELGAADEVNPYLVALIYAGDRQQAAPMIRAWLEAGKFVIIDRYVVSNIAYQCAKCTDPARREALREWILELEYGVNGIPRPDITLFLDVPFRFTEKKLTEQREGDDRGYLQGKCDIHESSLALQRAVREVYLDEARRSAAPQARTPGDRVEVVGCGDAAGNMLPPDAIFDKIREKILSWLGTGR